VPFRISAAVDRTNFDVEQIELKRTNILLI